MQVHLSKRHGWHDAHTSFTRSGCRLMPSPEPEASTPPTSSASDWRLLAPGPPTSSVVIAAGTVDDRHLVRGVLLQAARHLPRGLQDNLRSALQASPASRQDVFWTASRRQMSRASRPAHSQCSAIGQNCRCMLVFVSYFLYSIFYLPSHIVRLLYYLNRGDSCRNRNCSCSNLPYFVLARRAASPDTTSLSARDPRLNRHPLPSRGTLTIRADAPPGPRSPHKAVRTLLACTRFCRHWG
jgi:hypothetical protein